MRMKGEILAVETTGDQLRIKVQAVGAADAEWRRMNVITFECPDLDAYRKALHVGRQLVIDIRAVSR